MTNQEIIDAVRRDIREPSPITVSDAEITALYTIGADHIWEALLRSDPTLGQERVSLTSNGHVFSLPSNCLQITQVADMKTNALDITAASNATPIVIDVATPFTDGANVVVHGVLGNTAANGYWETDNAVALTSMELVGSVGDGAWTSGGKVFEEKSTFRKMMEIDPDESSFTKQTEYFLRHGNIVVDFPAFGNDLVLDYRRSISTVLTDIPTRYHLMLVSYVIMQFGRLPGQAENTADIDSMIKFHTQRFNNLMIQINGYLDQSRRPKRFNDSVQWESLY